MHRRILFGVAAWLLGAATATAGCLLAVSLLGQGITGASGPLLTQDAVNRALASESAEPSAGPTPSGKASAGTASGASPSGDATRSGATASPSASGTSAAPDGSPSAAPGTGTSSQAPPDSASGTVLTSKGGDVVASCLAAGAYLDSWSPAQGYLVADVTRGPAQTAGVTFEAGDDSGEDSGEGAVIMTVSCSGGVPSARVYTRQPGDD
jgi:hypothetical protein